MKRYYVCEKIGTGTFVDPFRPAVAKYNVNRVTVEADSKNWCLVLVNTVNHSQLLNDSQIDAMPDFPLDGKMTGMRTDTRQAMISALTNRGIDVSQIGSKDGYRDVIREIGKQLRADFDENNFDVSE